MPQIVSANHLTLSPEMQLTVPVMDYEVALLKEYSRLQHFQQLVNCIILRLHVIITEIIKP